MERIIVSPSSWKKPEMPFDATSKILRRYLAVAGSGKVKLPIKMIEVCEIDGSLFDYRVAKDEHVFALDAFGSVVEYEQRYTYYRFRSFLGTLWPRTELRKATGEADEGQIVGSMLNALDHRVDSIAFIVIRSVFSKEIKDFPEAYALKIYPVAKEQLLGMMLRDHYDKKRVGLASASKQPGFRSA